MRLQSDITQKHTEIIRQAIHDAIHEYEAMMQKRLTKISRTLASNPSMYQLTSLELDFICMVLNDSLYVLDDIVKDLDSYLGEAIDNIREDRDKAKELLERLEETISDSDDVYSLKQLGPVAAKYLETLQRSNEQLVKIAALLQKKQGKK